MSDGRFDLTVLIGDQGRSLIRIDRQLQTLGVVFSFLGWTFTRRCVGMKGGVCAEFNLRCGQH